MPATAPPPANAPVIVDSGPPKPPPPPTSEIHVSPAVIDNGPKHDPPKKGSAQSRMFEELRKRAKPQFFEPKEDAEPSTPPASSAPVEPTAPESEAQPGAAAPTSPDTDKAAAPSAKDAKAEKKNPWKLVDEYKARASKAEADLLEARKGSVAPQEKQQFETQIQELRKQNEELEKEIRFVNYSKSEEFKTKYQEPYNKAWARAQKELSEITVTAEDGSERPANVNDLAEIVNLPLGKARAAAEAAFGSFANDVMNYRKEILGLFEQQQTALEEAKNNSIKRDQEKNTVVQKASEEIVNHITKTWEKANAQLAEDPKIGHLFKQVEGDDDGNQRLAKGFALVDKAFSENPNDPNLTAEQREQVVSRHAAVRMRAAAFGRLNASYIKAQSQIKALEAELAKYQGTVPGTGGTSGPTTAPGQPASAWDNIRSGLRKIAKTT